MTHTVSEKQFFRHKTDQAIVQKDLSQTFGEI